MHGLQPQKPQQQQQLQQQSQSQNAQTSQQPPSKKRPSTSGLTPDGFWDDESDCDDGETEGDQDPRKEDWKIQKKKGFAKDRDEKAKILKMSKASKTSKRNSKPRCWTLK